MLKPWEQQMKELVELEATMTNEQLDAVETHETQKRARIAEENEY